MINTNEFTKKELAFGETDYEIENIYNAGKLPYMPARNSYDIPRPANLDFLRPDNSIMSTFMIDNEELASLISEFEGIVELKGLHSPYKTIDDNIVFTNGDLLKMIIDEMIFRQNRYKYNELNNK